MTETTAIVRARPNHAPSPAVRPAAVVPLDELQARLQFANALSKAGKLFPACYQNNPGGLLALMSWAEKHNKDLISAGQGVYVTKEGQMVVAAEMRVELANDRGYDMVDVTDDELRRELCTVEVRTPAGETHQLTVKLEDIPDDLKGPTKQGKPSAWMQNPEDMLLRTAQRRADKRFCRSAAVVLDARDEWETDDDAVDPVDVINEPQAEPEPEADDDVVDVDTVETTAADDEADLEQLTADPVTEEQLRDAASVPQLIKAATGIAGRDVPRVELIVEDQDLARAVLARAVLAEVTK